MEERNLNCGPFFTFTNRKKPLIEYDKSYIECVVFSRHEVPVTSQPITIVFMDDDIVVVNKPASIPVSGF